MTKKNIMNKIILKNAIDFWIFIPWFFPILPIVVLERFFNIHRIGIEGIIMLSFIFFIYFGVIPYFLKGYTIGGLVTGAKIVSKSNKTISPIIYFLRQVNSFKTILKGYMSGSIYLNKYLQFEHDKIYNTKIIIRSHPDSIRDNLEFNFVDVFFIHVKYWLICFLIIGAFLIPNFIKILGLA